MSSSKPLLLVGLIRIPDHKLILPLQTIFIMTVKHFRLLKVNLERINLKVQKRCLVIYKDP